MPAEIALQRSCYIPTLWGRSLAAATGHGSGGRGRRRWLLLAGRVAVVAQDLPVVRLLAGPHVLPGPGADGLGADALQGGRQRLHPPPAQQQRRQQDVAADLLPAAPAQAVLEAAEG